jgi:hypothetical protein
LGKQPLEKVQQATRSREVDEENDNFAAHFGRGLEGLEAKGKPKELGSVWFRF